VRISIKQGRCEIWGEMAAHPGRLAGQAQWICSRHSPILLGHFRQPEGPESPSLPDVAIDWKLGRLGTLAHPGHVRIPEYC